MNDSNNMEQFNRYRIDSDHLFRTLDNWDRLMRFQVKLIACGGTALTLAMQKFSHLVERLHTRKLIGDDFREKVRAEA